MDNYRVEVMITLGLVTGGYALAAALQLSGPIAIVVAGLLIGNQGRRFAMSDQTREHLDTFWELVDEVFNGVLFVLIGLKALQLSFTASWLEAGMAAIPTALDRALAERRRADRPVAALAGIQPGQRDDLSPGAAAGGIPVALALSLAERRPERELDPGDHVCGGDLLHPGAVGWR